MSPLKTKVPVFGLASGMCRNGLHDLAADGVWIVPKTGAWTCFLCRRAAKEREYALRPKAPPRRPHIKPKWHGPVVPPCVATKVRFTSCHYCMTGREHHALGSPEYRLKQQAIYAAREGLTVEQLRARKAKRLLLLSRLKAGKRRGHLRIERRKSKPRFMRAHLARELRRGTCYWCEARIPDGELDHIIPLSRGGDHSVGNTVLACVPCNQSKGSMLVAEWRRSDAYLPDMGF